MRRKRLCSAVFGAGLFVGSLGVALAADTLTIEGLPKDPKAYRAQVDQILKKADALIEKLKEKPNPPPIVLDLIQTRDNILREIFKVENKPEGSKWFDQEMRDSVDAMLRLLKQQYDKGVELAG
ncbi:hypothetical protein [Nitrospira sp. Kam-Ns4a]